MGRPVSHPEVDEAMLRELYERRAMSVQRVADVTGLHKRGVYRRLVDYGIPTRHSGLRGSVPYARPAEVLTPEALHQLADVDGLKFGEIARRTGFDPKTVKRYLSAAGIVPPPKPPPMPRVDGRRVLRAHPEVDEAVLRDLYQRQALSVTEVAVRTGLDQATVSRRLARYGIPTRRPSPTPLSNP